MLKIGLRARMRTIDFRQAWVALFFVVAVTTADAADVSPMLFERDVRPILKAHCWQCHGDEEKPEAALDLRLVRFMLKGGESGPAVVAGKSAESLIWNRI